MEYLRITEYTLILLIILLGSMTTVSDIRCGIISNRILAIFTVIGAAINVALYGIWLRDDLTVFLLNNCVCILFSLCLYFTHSFAGGDCKLVIVMSFLYPAGMYLIYEKSIITLFLAICLGIFWGYIYLLLDSIRKIVSGITKIDKNKVTLYLSTYLKVYLAALIYIACVSLIVGFVNQTWIHVPDWTAWIICVAVAWVVGRINLLRNRILIWIITVIDIALSIYLKVFPISINPRTYIFTAMLVLFQMAIKTNMYEVISTDRIEKGMILSMVSSMAMQRSKIDHMPGISTEDLRSRLTEEEAISISKWGKTKRGLKKITIIKKVPFAVFIFAGYISYFLIWRLIT